ncbi:hypothetical protein [Acetomicrobium sp.]
MQQICVEIVKNNLYNCIKESTSSEDNIAQLEKLIGALIDLVPPASAQEECKSGSNTV